MPIKIRYLGPCVICNQPQWAEVHKADKGTDVRGVKAHQFESKPWKPKT